MFELRDEVFLEWGKRVRETVKEAEQLPHPILIHTLPTLYNYLVEAIIPDSPKVTAEEGNTLAAEHGGERARLTNYHLPSVISEYQILRWTIFDVLQRNEVQLNNEEVFVINASIDRSIRESVNAFALAQAMLRERFVATLAHDLLNPLTAACTSLELIEYSSDLEKIKRLAARTTDNLSRMDAMIRDLLDSVIFQTGERLHLRLSKFDIHEIVKEVCEEFSLKYGSRFQLTGKMVRGCWDQEAIKRALENVIGNAVKYGAPATPIHVKIDSEGERLMLSVHNEGEPIPPQQFEYIFQVFQRAAGAGEGHIDGWGIGLAYVRSVAESHGGNVVVDSEVHRGTTFMIDIPVDATPYQDALTMGQKA
jgi:signal transduction histidine kinase